MSRHTPQRTTATSSFSHMVSSHSRGPGSPHRLVQHSLQDSMPAEPKGLRGGELPKRAGKGKDQLNGGTEGHNVDDQSSAEDDEDSDDEDDDGDKHDAMRPARANSTEPEALAMNSAAGPNKKRDFDEVDDEPDYPRKKIPKHISTTTQGILAYQEPRFMHDDKTDDEDEEDGDEEEYLLEDDDGNITDQEEAAIVREFENDEELLREIGILDDPTGCAASPLPNLNMSAELLDSALFDDLDGELFDAMCNEPHRFDDLQGQSAYDWNSFTAESDNDLFSVHPTPGVTPNATPRTSISVAPTTAARRGSFTSEGNDSDETSEDEVAKLSPFFEAHDATLKHIVTTEGKGAWSDGTDDDDADLMKYFFSSADDDSEETDNDDSDDADDDDALTVDGGETTDEEEDLPMPTPCHASKLRRASVSSVRAQIIDTNNEGPELCSWVADPSRPICVIEGTKQTFLIPDSYRRFSVGGRTGSTTSDQWVPMEGESESEQSTIPPPFDPTLSGLTGVEGGAFDMGDILGPSEAFYPFTSETGEVFSDLFPEDDCEVDEYEARLAIDDFLDLSSAEEGRDEVGKEVVEGLSDDAGVEEGLNGGLDEEDERVPDSGANADVFKVWSKVGVSAFRQRQMQHLHKNHQSSAGYHKGREGRLSETITPTKKRRVRQKFLSSNRGALGDNAAVRKKLAR